MSTRKNLTLIRNQMTLEQRMQARIDAFKADIFCGDGDMQYVEQIMSVCLDYVQDYEDEDIEAACVKIKESIFYLNNFINYDQ